MDVVSFDYGIREFISKGEGHGPRSTGRGSKRKGGAAPIGIVACPRNRVADGQIKAVVWRIVKVNDSESRAVGTRHPIRAAMSGSGFRRAEEYLFRRENMELCTSSKNENGNTPFG
jgi:hypothetical protein